MGLYDKIRKRKKENLEQVYKNLTHPISMAEAISSPAKFKSVTGKDTGAYESSTTIDPDASTKSGEEIVNTIEDEGKCVNGFWVGGENNGEECSEITPDENLDKLDEAKKKLSDFKGSRDDVNPDMPEGEKGLFGKQKGGSALGNIIRKIVGKTGEAEILDAAPFKRAGNLNTLSAGGGNQGDIGDTGDANKKDTFEINDGKTVINTDYTGEEIGVSETSEDVNPTKTFTGMDDACSEEYIAANGSDACEKWKKDNEANPCHGAEADGRAKACTDKGGTLKVVEGVCKCVTAGSDDKPSSITSNVIEGTEEEIPGEVSQNMSFADQLRTNWGQNLLDKRTQNREKKELKHNKKDFTKNEKDLFQSARKSLRKSGDLPGSKDEKLRAIYNEMDEQAKWQASSRYQFDNNIMDMSEIDPKTGESYLAAFEAQYKPEKTYGGQRSMYDIAQGVKDGTGSTYKELVDLKDDKGNRVYSDEELEQIRDLTDNQGRKGSSEYQRTEETTLPPEYTNTLKPEQLELVKNAKTKEEAEAILKKYYDENPDAANARGDHSVYSKPPAQIKSGGFKMKRGKLIRPGY